MRFFSTLSLVIGLATLVASSVLDKRASGGCAVYHGGASWSTDSITLRKSIEANQNGAVWRYSADYTIWNDDKKRMEVYNVNFDYFQDKEYSIKVIPRTDGAKFRQFKFAVAATGAGAIKEYWGSTAPDGACWDRETYNLNSIVDVSVYHRV